MHSRFYRPFHPETAPESSLQALIRSFALGRTPTRPLTATERLVLTLSAAEPQRHLIIPAPYHDRAGATSGWSSLKKRLGRSRSQPRIAYVGTLTKALGAAGWHFHFLLWGDHVYWEPLTGHCRTVGLGYPRISSIKATPQDQLMCTSYVLGQNVRVFDDRHAGQDLRSEVASRGSWSLLRQHESTLASIAPEVLSALQNARDQSWSDIELCRASPLFTSTCTRDREQLPDVLTTTRDQSRGVLCG